MASRKAIFIAAIVVIAIAAVAVAGIVIIDNNNNKEYTVTYDYNYADAPASKTVSYKNNTNITDTVLPVRTDYVFGGWYYDKECTEKVVLPYKITGNTTWYALWIKFDMSKYIDVNFLTDTEYGKYITQSEVMTTGYEDIVIPGIDLTKQFASIGLKHAVYVDSVNNKCIIMSLEEDKKICEIPMDVFETIAGKAQLRIASIGLEEFNHEFVVIKNTINRYFVISLDSNDIPIINRIIGPAINEPEFILNEYVIVDGACYSFDEDNGFELEFLVTSTHRPSEAGDTTYCEVEYDTSGNAVRANILDDKFDVKMKVEFPSGSHRGVCFHTEGDSYLVQYSVKTTGNDYTYSEDGVRYKLVSQIIDGSRKSATFVSISYPAFAATDMTKLYHFASMYADDIHNVISFYDIDSNKVLKTEGKLLMSLDNNGNVIKSFSISAGNYSFAFLFPTTTEDRYYLWSATIDGEGSVKTVKNIIDGKANVILSDIVVATCSSCFIRNTEGDYSIYDINGKVIGNYEGMTPVDCTNNVMFFTDGDGKLYAFRNGSMTEMTDYKGDLVCRSSYYGYKVGENQYKFFAENGSLITESSTRETRERTNFAGEHLAEFYLGSGVFKIVRLTTATV